VRTSNLDTQFMDSIEGLCYCHYLNLTIVWKLTLRVLRGD